YRFAWPKWLPQDPISIDALLSLHKTALQSIHGSVDLLVGGPPCQGFSSAGRRRHNDPRNKLFTSYLELVHIIRPRAVLIENVRGFTVDFNSETRVRNFARSLRTKLAATYDVYEKVLNLSSFGVPQLRNRYFM